MNGVIAGLSEDGSQAHISAVSSDDPLTTVSPVDSRDIPSTMSSLGSQASFSLCEYPSTLAIHVAVLCSVYRVCVAR